MIFLRAAGAFFFGRNGVPWFFRTCDSPVEVFLRAAGALFSAKMTFLEFFKTCERPVEVFLHAAGAFFSAKMTFLGFLGHVIALLRSSHLPQALFFRQKWRSLIFRTCNSPVEVFLRAAGGFFRQQVTHKWLWLYL